MNITNAELEQRAATGILPFGECDECKGLYPALVEKLADGLIAKCGRCRGRLEAIVFLDSVSAARRGWTLEGPSRP